MPRDSSGNYTLPAGNPVVDGTIIATDWANPTMSDIATQLNNVLTRDGLLGPIAPLLIVDGTPTQPGLAFNSQVGTGWWRDATKVGFSYGGVTSFTVNGSGLSPVQPVGFANGTELLPSITFAAETGSGLFRESAGVVAWSIAGTKIGNWSAAGLTVTPGKVLTAETGVFGTGTPSGGLQLRSTNKLSFTDTVGQTYIHAPESNTVALGTAGVERMRVASSGNVGVGTDAPTQLFQVGKFDKVGAMYQRISGQVADIYLGQSASNLFGLNPLSCAFIFQDAANNVALALGTLGPNSLNFGTNNFTRMSIDANGVVRSAAQMLAEGITATPRWQAGIGAVDLGLGGSAVVGGDSGAYLVGNLYQNAGWRYSNTYSGVLAAVDDAGFTVFTAPASTPGNVAPITNRLQVAVNGQVSIAQPAAENALTIGNGSNGATAFVGAGFNMGRGQRWVSNSSEFWSANAINIGTDTAASLSLRTDSLEHVVIQADGTVNMFKAFAPAYTRWYLKSIADGHTFTDVDCGPGAHARLVGSGTINTTIPNGAITPGNILYLCIYSFALTTNINWAGPVQVFDENTGVALPSPLVISGVGAYRFICIESNTYVFHRS